MPFISVLKTTNNTCPPDLSMKKYTHKPQPTITKKIATDLNVDHAIAKRLVELFNAHLYMDVELDRSRVGSRSSQILLGLSYSKLAHLREIAVDGTHKHSYLVNCMLAAAGYCRATGVDAVFHTLIKE